MLFERSVLYYVVAMLLPRFPMPRGVDRVSREVGHVCLPAVSACSVQPSDTAPSRSRTWTLRLPAILHRNLTYHGCCCRGHNRMRPVFGTSLICALMFLDSGVAGAIGGAVGVGDGF